MRAEDTPEPAEEHRPLPSVKIPLLREERRAAQVKQVAVGAAVALGLVVAVTAAVLLRRPEQEGATRGEGAAAKPGPGGTALPDAAGEAAADAPDAHASRQPPPTPVTPGAVDRKEVPFGTAGSFRQAVANAGIAQGPARELEDALRGVLDFRRCRPTDRMVCERDGHGNVVLFEYHPGPTEYVQATRGTDGELRAEHVQVPITKVRRAVGGRITTSLGDALEQLGLGRTLVGVFVSVFEGRVNFSTDTRKGDAFRIIVDEEKIEARFLQFGTDYAVEYDGARTGKLRAYWYEPRKGEGDYYDPTGRAVQGGWLRTPLRYDHISSPFSLHRMHPILHRIVPHNGVDYAAGVGTPIWATADGTVTFAARKGANGNLVVIRHRDGYESLYCHLSRFARGIHKGVQVKQRQIIGYVGSTGRSTGPHLHFSLRRYGKYLDPLKELNGPGRQLPASELSAFKRTMKKMDAELAKIPVGPAPPGSGTQVKGNGTVDEPMD